MTATAPNPICCPHGTYIAAESARRDAILGTYEDGCRCSSGIPTLFWCGEGEMTKPNGVRIYAGEYLAAWDEALVLNAGDELYDRAVMLNEISDNLAHFAIEPVELDICGWCGGLAQLNDQGACSGCHEIDDEDSRSHAEYLGEVPWTDRVED